MDAENAGERERRERRTRNARYLAIVCTDGQLASAAQAGQDAREGRLPGGELFLKTHPPHPSKLT